MIPQKAFDELVAGLLAVGEKKIHSIILYGSVARGTAEPDSDVDIAILLKEEFTKEEKNKINDFLAGMDLEYNTLFSTVKIPIERYRKWLNALPFYQNIQNEGVLLWEAA